MSPRDPKERRGAPRSPGGLHLGLPGRVTFMSKKVRAIGRSVNMSPTGVLIASPQPHPSVGTEVELYFVKQGSQDPPYAVGEVVRQTDSGFALRFLPIHPEVREALDSLVRKKR